MTERREWMPRAEWDALVRGEGCPLCVEVAALESVNTYGHTIADLRLSRLRLASNQSVRGYCVLICSKHVREPYELSGKDRRAFFEEMMQAGQALESVFQSIKMNFEILGNAVPHLHCHIIPRYYGDRAPGLPIHPDEEVVHLTVEEYEQQVASIRSTL
ncbi:MAG: HIT family protein [Chloroflexota bacterium]|nr:MAG: hypothetical protein DLM70_04065 [Chloroflexota bacterium]